MAKEIVVWCDVHLDRERMERRPARSIPLLIGKLERTLDLCGECEGTYVQPLRGLMESLGAKADAPTPPRADVPPLGEPVAYPCPLCPKGYSGAGKLRTHLANTHDRTDTGLTTGHCPVCGMEWSGMGTHLRSHRDEVGGLLNTAQSLIWARENGDPHGQYAVWLAKG